MEFKSENNKIKSTGFFNQKMARRAFFTQFSLLSCVLVSSCSSVRILLDAYPEKFKTDDFLIDEILRSFVVTVIPGAPFNEPNLTTIYHDNYYPFYRFCSFFVYDLSKRSDEMFDEKKFHELSFQQRTEVITNGLQSGGPAARIYKAAIFMAQASFYGGIYDDIRGCQFIEFHGENSGFSNDEITYPNCFSLLADETTENGNYN